MSTRTNWIGVGGHAELGESPEECLLREVKEETGYTLTSWRFRGLVTFVTEAENSKTGGVHGVYVSLHGRRIHGRTDCM